MKPQFTLVAGLLLVVALFADVRSGTPNEKASSDFETRCGWFDNPTPSNIWLYDREAEWTIGIRGGYVISTVRRLSFFQGEHGNRIAHALFLQQH